MGYREKVLAALKEKNINLHEWQTWLQVFAIVLYVAAIGIATLFVWQLIDIGIAASNYRLLAHIGAALTSTNAIILPLALYFWFFDKSRRKWGKFFYVGELFLIAMNILTAYNYNASNGNLPPILEFWLTWVVPAMFMYVLPVWGVLLPMSPEHQRAYQEKERELLRESERADALHASKMAEIISESEATYKKAYDLLKRAGRIDEADAIIPAAYRDTPNPTQASK